MPGIYGFFDAVTNECLYVGQTFAPPYIRYNGHLKKLRSGSHPRKDWVEWYSTVDSDEMIFSWIEDTEEELLNAREIHWFYELEPRFFGKLPSNNERWSHSDGTKAKIAESVRVARGNNSGASPERKYKGQVCTWPRKISKQDLSKLHDAGLSLRQIAFIYNVSHVTVRNYLIDYQINPL